MKRTNYFFMLMFVWAALAISCGQVDPKNEEAETTIPVEVTAVRLGEVAQMLGYYGDIEAENEVKVFSKIPDRIEQFFVDDGDRVAKGAPLAKIFALTIEQSVRQAEAGLVAVKAQEANLRVEFERLTLLHRDHSISQQQYDAMAAQYQAVQAQVQQAEAVLASANSQLHDALVSAPIAGIIGKRYCEAGDMATPALPLARIVQMERVKILVDAGEEDLARLALGQKAVVRVKTFPDSSFMGKVSKISPVLDPLTRMAEIEILLDNREHHLKPGMYAQAQITTGVLQNVIVIPRHAVIENTSLERVAGEDRVVKNYYAFVAVNGKAQQRKLSVLYINDECLAVSAGLAPGEKLVVVGQHNLRDGVPLVIVREEVPAS